MNKPIKVLHIVSGNLAGGAGRGVLWLHQALLEQDLNSLVLCSQKPVNTYRGVEYYTDTLFRKVSFYVSRKMDRLVLKAFPKRKRGISLGWFGVNITKLKCFRQADIIHLHWINDGFISVRGIGKFNKPIVWTLRDMWPMTGICHYSISCDNYTRGCGNCHFLGSNLTADLSRLAAWMKRRYYPKNMQLVGISNWITDQALGSILFKGYSIETIANIVDLNKFQCIEKSAAREELNIITKKKILLVSSVNISAYYKGFSLLLESLQRLDKSKYLVVLLGRVDKDSVSKINQEVLVIPFTTDPIELNNIYCCADVFMAPSIQEAFGKTVVESLSSGVPVVCWDNSAPSEIVQHKETGYLARAFDTDDFAQGIEWIANNSKYSILSQQGVTRVNKRYAFQLAANKYRSLYINNIERYNSIK
jgi:glycosyltransferase involved in cell wall biosynthesis